MKMVVTLCVSASGKVQQKMRPNTQIVAGDLLARIVLDDPSLVTKTQNFSGSFPPTTGHIPKEAKKLNQIYQKMRQDIDNILCGARGPLHHRATKLDILSVPPTDNRLIIGVGLVR